MPYGRLFLSLNLWRRAAERESQRSFSVGQRSYQLWNLGLALRAVGDFDVGRWLMDRSAPGVPAWSVRTPCGHRLLSSRLQGSRVLSGPASGGSCCWVHAPDGVGY